MYWDDSVTFDLCCMRTLTFDDSFLYFDPIYENERILVWKFFPQQVKLCWSPIM